MKRRAVVFLLFGCFASALTGAQTIAYFAGPAFTAAGTQLDINADGVPDFSFFMGQPICTASIPPCCTFPHYVDGGTNELLGTDYASLIPLGALIGSNAEGETWTTGTLLTVYHSGWSFPDPTPDPYYFGPLGSLGVGYLGVRFYATDGLHYGWVRIRLPATYQNQTLPEFISPVVMEWAYETRPNTPIHAGDTGENRTEFKVDFPTDGAIIQGEDYSSGRILLGKDSLSYEIHLAGGGTPTGLTIESSQPNRKPLAAIDFPYIHVHLPYVVVRSDFTLLFGEVSLAHGQAIQLSRGRYYLKRDGEVIGVIVPNAP